MPTKKSTAPNPKEVAGLEDGGEGVVVLVKAFDGGGIFGEGKGEGGGFGGVLEFVVVYMEMEEEEDEGKELEKL